MEESIRIEYVSERKSQKKALSLTGSLANRVWKIALRLYDATESEILAAQKLLELLEAEYSSDLIQTKLFPYLDKLDTEKNLPQRLISIVQFEGLSLIDKVRHIIRTNFDQAQSFDSSELLEFCEKFIQPGMKQSTISTYLSRLNDEGILRLVSSKARPYKYQLTELGRKEISPIVTPTARTELERSRETTIAKSF